MVGSDAELLDLYDEHGARLGGSKPRRLVHRDGDWHRTFHCWVVARRGHGAGVILQRRSVAKDVHPGLLDVSAAGHLSAGEGDADGVRELAEELGIDVPFGRLRLLAVTREEATGAGIVDREHCATYLLRHDAELAAYRPAPDEVDALVELPVAAGLALARGEVDAVEATMLTAGPATVAPVTVRREEFVARPWAYYAAIFEQAAAAAAGPV
jgi:isopentenyldiphosphate isomerase